MGAYGRRLEGAGGALMTEPQPVKVSIETPPLTARIKATGTIDAVVKRTLALYQSVLTPDMAKPGAAVGFQAERLPEEL